MSQMDITLDEDSANESLGHISESYDMFEEPHALQGEPGSLTPVRIINLNASMRLVNIQYSLNCDLR